MPSDLSTPRTDVRRANLEASRSLDPYGTLEVRGPFIGYIPDIDPNALPGTMLSKCLNLQASPLPPGTTGGEYLISSPGYVQIDPSRLPLKDDVDGIGAPSGIKAPVIALSQLQRTTTSGTRSGEEDTSPLALVANAGTGAAMLYRISPTSGQWTPIEPVGANIMATNRDSSNGFALSMPHFAAYAAGIDALRHPIMVMCNPTDDVMFWPDATGDYAPLDGAGAGAALFTHFKARSCASWNGHMYFLATSEDGVVFRNRIRRTLINDAGALTGTGAGARDVRQFNRDGVRLEPIGDLLACYFEDGVAFLHPTEVASAPDELEIVTKKRGLLGTHAMDSIGASLHFGIYTDGWFILDERGEFHEVGVGTIEGVKLHKWKDTFYNRLDENNRHRIQVKYEKFSNRVFIAVPVKDVADVNETWIYDIDSDRVFIDEYPVTCFGDFDQQVRTALTFDSFAGAGAPAGWEDFFTPGGSVPAPPATTMDDMTIAGDAMGALFTFERLVHGNLQGLVYGHTQNFTSRGSDTEASASIATQPPFIARFGVRQRQSSRLISTVDRVTVEYNTYRPDGGGNEDASVTVFGNTGVASQTRMVDLNKGDTDEIHRSDAWFRFTAPSIGVELSGTSPVAVRSMSIDVWQHEVEDRG